jgi:nitroimidazol reductase NimA-like FMN-containing flavoprotein (pyridoxamine 5'-phosphate oxidase superfamily)
MDDEQAESAHDLTPTSRTKVRRMAERGRYDWATITGILDEGIVAHVGFDGATGVCVLPMAYGRVDDRLYLHGAVGNAMLNASSDADVCVTVTLVDGLVLSRSAFHHSMNYRSVVVVGRTATAHDAGERDVALQAIVNHTVSGRADECRPPSDAELRKTRVLRLDITEASAKVRSGPPIEDPDDLELPYWAGEIPLRIVPGAPVADEFVPADAAAPVLARRTNR